MKRCSVSEKAKAPRLSQFCVSLPAALIIVIILSQISYRSASAQDPAVEKGKAVYNGIGACASCHGPEGKGDGVAAAALMPKPRSFASGDFVYDTDGDGKKGSEADLLNIITNGAQKYNGSPLMVGRPDIPEEDRKALVKFIESLKK